jgi:hypothetical protein
MHPLEFVLVIVGMVLVFKLVKTVMMQKHGRRDDHVNAELVARLAEVEERVRVLERIVTDDRSELKRQFRDLEA